MRPHLPRNSRRLQSGLIAVAALLASLACLPAQGEAAGAVPRLEPHRAIYDISLVEASHGLDLADLSGRMVVEWRGPGCPAYRVTQRILTYMNDKEGAIFSRDMQVESRETQDGGMFSFEFKHFADGELNEHIAGEASRGLDRAHVAFSTPVGQTLNLPRDVLFPTQLTFGLIDAARRGDRVFQGNVYEGSEIDRYFEVTAFLPGRAETGAPPGVEIRGKPIGRPLDTIESWPVHLSYFDVGQPEGLPDYEISFRQFENGISSDLVMNYGDLILRAELKRIDYLSPGDC